MSPTIQQSCKRCGTCCSSGGPALHLKDSTLLKKKIIPKEALVCIRKNEPVVSPISGHAEPAKAELIKISGGKNSWDCCFFSPAKNSCLIYQYRPLECHLLKCWDTQDIIAQIYRNNLTRKDLFAGRNDILSLISDHEIRCSFARLQHLSEKTELVDRQHILDELSEILNTDLQIRRKAAQTFRLSLKQELLMLGRPMFKSAMFYGLTVREDYKGLVVAPMVKP